MNGNLKLLVNWCNTNKLTVNSRKTKFVLFDRSGGKNLQAKLDLKINGSRLEGTDR